MSGRLPQVRHLNLPAGIFPSLPWHTQVLRRAQDWQYVPLGQRSLQELHSAFRAPKCAAMTCGQVHDADVDDLHTTSLIRHQASHVRVESRPRPKEIAQVLVEHRLLERHLSESKRLQHTFQQDPRQPAKTLSQLLIPQPRQNGIDPLVAKQDQKFPRLCGQALVRQHHMVSTLRCRRRGANHHGRIVQPSHKLWWAPDGLLEIQQPGRGRGKRRPDARPLLLRQRLLRWLGDSRHARPTGRYRRRQLMGDAWGTRRPCDWRHYRAHERRWARWLRARANTDSCWHVSRGCRRLFLVNLRSSQQVFVGVAVVRRAASGHRFDDGI